jgi:hypothetical protein
MRSFFLGVVGTIALASGALATEEGIGGNVNGDDLVVFCSVGPDDADYAAAIAFCYGYLDAALDYHAALTAGDGFDAIVCPPVTVTREEIAANVVSFAGDNSDKAGENSPIHIVMEATASNWPCAAD